MTFRETLSAGRVYNSTAISFEDLFVFGIKRSRNTKKYATQKKGSFLVPYVLEELHHYKTLERSSNMPFQTEWLF